MRGDDRPLPWFRPWHHKEKGKVRRSWRRRQRHTAIDAIRDGRYEIAEKDARKTEGWESS